MKADRKEPKEQFIEFLSYGNFLIYFGIAFALLAFIPAVIVKPIASFLTCLFSFEYFMLVLLGLVVLGFVLSFHLIVKQQKSYSRDFSKWRTGFGLAIIGMIGLGVFLGFRILVPPYLSVVQFHQYALFDVVISTLIMLWLLFVIWGLRRF